MESNTNKGIIAWFARNSVAANLLMVVLLIGGLFSTALINKEVFPTFELNYLQISVAYPGAAPQEIEEGININYVYGSVAGPESKCLFVFCPEDIELASKIFTKDKPAS